jgi:hypothetical protein
MMFQVMFHTFHSPCSPWFELPAAPLLYVSSMSIQWVRSYLQARTVGLTIHRRGMAHMAFGVLIDGNLFHLERSRRSLTGATCIFIGLEKSAGAVAVVQGLWHAHPTGISSSFLRPLKRFSMMVQISQRMMARTTEHVSRVPRRTVVEYHEE